MEKKDQRRNYP